MFDRSCKLKSLNTLMFKPCRHPDKNQGSSEATHMMQQLNAAKDKLGQDDGYSGGYFAES